MSNGSDIAAEIRAGLIEAGEATGDGPNYCVIRRNDPDATVASDPEEAETIQTIEPIQFEAVIVEGANMVKDRDGALTGVVQRTLTIDATSVEPLKSDLIAIGKRISDSPVLGDFEEVESVKTLRSGGVALMYKVMMKD